MKHKAIISRRGVLKTVAAAAAAAASGALGGAGAWAAPQASATRQAVSGNRPRTLALIGDRWHNSDYIRVSLDRVFKDLNLPIDYTTNYYDLSPGLLQPYQLFVCLRDNMIWPGGYGTDRIEELENPGEFPCRKRGVLDNGRARESREGLCSGRERLLFVAQQCFCFALFEAIQRGSRRVSVEPSSAAAFQSADCEQGPPGHAGS